MVDHGLVSEYPREPFYIISGETFVHFAVLSKTRRHEIEGRFNSGNNKAIWKQLHVNVSGDLLLAADQKGFHIAHDRIQILPFMQPVSVELCKLVFPG